MRSPRAKESQLILRRFSRCPGIVYNWCSRSTTTNRTSTGWKS